MKTILTIMLCLVVGITQAQDGIAISVTQDGRLLLLGDDKGNDPLTANPTIRVNLEGYQGKVGFSNIIAEYEYADLEGGHYHRYSAGYAHNFNYMPIPFTNKVYELQPSLQYGVIARENRGSTFTFIGDIDLLFKMTNKLKILVSNEWTQRTELKGSPIRYSLKAGLQYKLF